MDDLRRRLLAWYDTSARDLPWRGCGDAYAVWVSEAMLQQTRVAAVVGHYGRWMRRFPTVEALAEAPWDDVAAHWAGLGYYARARALQRAAREVVERHGGRVPNDPADLLRLPGVGPYTAGAVASIAYGRRVAAVDGNAVRVLCRLDLVRGDPQRPEVRRRIEARAAELVDPARPGDWNQALMELGALVCTPRAPRCGECPLAGVCKARAQGAAHQVPPPRRKAAPRVERLRFALVRDGGQVLLVRNPPHGMLGGTWRLPGGVGDGGCLATAVEEETGVRVRLEGPVCTARHVFTHRVWEMQVEPARVVVGRVEQATRAAATAEAAAPEQGAAAVAWVPEEELGRRALSTAMRKALAAAHVHAPEPGGSARGPSRRLALHSFPAPRQPL